MKTQQLDLKQLTLPKPDYNMYKGSHKIYTPRDVQGHLDLDAEDMGLLNQVISAAGLDKCAWSDSLGHNIKLLCDAVLLDLFYLRLHLEQVCVSNIDLDESDQRLRIWFVKAPEQTIFSLH